MDEVDDWFYDSIKRYNKLQMFTLNENVHHIEFAPNKSNICVSNENLTTRRCQILEYELPSKFLDTSDTLCSSDHNLKIVCGTYVDHLILELKVLASFNKIITSEKHQSGVHLYSLPDNGSDKILRTDFIKSDHPEPRLASQPQSEHVLALSHSTGHPVSVVDILANARLQRIHVDWDSALESTLRTGYIDTNTLCVCLENCGVVLLYDLRCPNEVMSSSAKGPSKPNGQWTMSLSESDMSSPTINLISSLACARMLDPRNLAQPMFHCQLELPTSRSPADRHLETCPQNSRIFSVSGFDENVHIYERTEQTLCSEVFTHDAHPYQELCDKNTRVLCHRWMPRPHERLMISSADNASVTCVQFNSESS